MEEIKQPENFEDDNIWCEGTTEVAEQQINQSFEATHLNGPEPSDEGPLGSMDDDDDDSFRNPFNDDIFSENDNAEPQNEIGEPTPLPQSYSDSGSQVESRIPELNDNVGQDNKKNMPAATSAGLHSQQNEVNYGVPGTHQQNPVHLTSQIPPLNGFNTSYQHKPSAQATLEAVEPLFSAQRNTQQIEQVHSNNLDSANQGQSVNALSNSDVPSASEIIELLEEEDEPKPIQQAQQFSGIKRARPEVTSNGQQIAPASASYNARYNQMPDWMKQKPSRQGGVLITPGSSLPGYQRMLNSQAPAMQNSALAFPRKVQHQPYYVTLPPSFVPTWRILLPQSEIRRQGRKSYELSLLNVKEFTITGLPIVMDGPPSSITGLRKKIKEISRDYGTAIFEREGDGGLGRWKIPLGAYHAFYSYLNSDPMCQVIGIPVNQLKIASLGKARLEKGFPTLKKLVAEGVPRGLATALAPFQRGGVDFVIEKEGRALIADEMGLGKTIQSIAGLTVYHREWPLLVLTPSSARYHWEHEFQHWLGADSVINTTKQERMNLGGESDDDDEELEEENMDESKCMPLLNNSQIHVLTNSKEPVIPNDSVRVVICSYGLAPMLVNSGKIYPSLFQCAIVDESHMLKNMATKRTSALVPILHATSRCVLLSGTPALARPSELWPQLKILGTERQGWWDDEDEFVKNYVKRSSPTRRAELHTMLTGTVMIRRMKQEILKSLPKKMREKAVVDVSSSEERKEFHQCMALLRKGKGILGKLARQHSALSAPQNNQDNSTGGLPPIDDNEQTKDEEANAALKQEYSRKYNEGMNRINHAFVTTQNQLSDEQKNNLLQKHHSDLRQELDVWFREQTLELQQQQTQLQLDRKSVLNKMYTLTARAKLPLISDMIKKWLGDRTKGKLCVFAHHLLVLDELISRAGLSNEKDSETRYIRIDGSTSPKERQAQIKTFQTDPSVRIAILGITAAGVAVTLTAASTVWFAELFWTPALMIQAEDRCHRIGQNTRVKTLYFVAVGTLDELLWKLLEKKFQDLGEFVEGQENQKMVVHKHYHGTKELFSIFSVDEVDLDEEEKWDEEAEAEGQELLALEHDLENDIDMLGKEELTMFSPDDDDELNGDDKPDQLASQSDKSEPILGCSEEEAILLSDDEEEAIAASVAPNIKNNYASVTNPSEDAKSPPSGEIQPATHNGNSEQINFDIERLRNCRAYNLLFDGPSFGIQLFILHHRMIVGRIENAVNCKPRIGDILVAINGQVFPFVKSLGEVIPYMKTAISRGSAELTFVECDDLTRFVKAKIDAEAKRRYKAMQAKLAEMPKKPAKAGEVIDLLEDDD